MAALLFSIASIRGQTLTLETSCSGTTWHIGLECTWAGTFGDCFTETITQQGNSLTQGFHQPDGQLFGMHELFASIKVAAYPNPVKEKLFVTIKGAGGQMTIKAVLADLRGKIVRSFIVTDGINELNLNRMAPGLLILTLSAEGHILGNTKISKVR